MLRLESASVSLSSKDAADNFSYTSEGSIGAFVFVIDSLLNLRREISRTTIGPSSKPPSTERYLSFGLYFPVTHFTVSSWFSIRILATFLVLSAMRVPAAMSAALTVTPLTTMPRTSGARAAEGPVIVPAEAADMRQPAANAAGTAETFKTFLILSPFVGSDLSSPIIA
ncbi:unnamed protein product [Pseudo-nitzschia multistriata]|uniref:Uncharacterized protein n=1 Tax=Pseudo-nitzschia multistriata TaxID=183589 RepID=A0A448Z720_9STRA|nr:unnamed protein product [Pseudo-nitzschia multistriata]